MESTSDESLKIVYDHYKDSFEQIRRYTATRNKLFVYVLLGATAMQLLNPAEAQSVLAQLLEKYVGVSPKVTMQSAATSLWIGVLYGLIRYFQTTLTVDLQYESLHKIERELSEHLSAPEFKRERRGYERDFRGFRFLVSLFYRALVPVALILCLLSRLITEYKYADRFSSGIILDGGLFVCASLVTILYVYESIWGTSKNQAVC